MSLPSSIWKREITKKRYPIKVSAQLAKHIIASFYFQVRDATSVTGADECYQVCQKNYVTMTSSRFSWFHKPIVVNLDQHLGASHSKHWSMSSAFSTKKAEKRREAKKNRRKIQQNKACFWVCSQTLVEDFFCELWYLCSMKIENYIITFIGPMLKKINF